jgi:hypothetical protein
MRSVGEWAVLVAALLVAVLLILSSTTNQVIAARLPADLLHGR